MANVSIAGREVKLDHVQESPGKFAALLERAKSEDGHAFCLCSLPKRLRLVVRRKGATLFLAKWPHEGALHDESCWFHKVRDELTGRSGYAKKAIEDEDGVLSIKCELALSLSTEEARASTQPRVSQTTGQGLARRSVGLLGLLHYLWETARLNRWHPSWKRSWSMCEWQIGKVLNGEINGADLKERVYVVPAFAVTRAEAQNLAFDQFKRRLGLQAGRRERGVVIGELREIRSSKYGYQLVIRGTWAKFYMTEALGRAIKNSAGSVFSGQGVHDARAIVVMCVDRTDEDNLNVVSLAAMLTNSKYLPADSTHEVRMADALVAAGRRLIKPLRYDHTERVFPDFVLLDEEPNRYVEVYGMSGMESYDARKREKQAIYREDGIPVLEWDVSDPLPDVSHARTRGMK